MSAFLIILTILLAIVKLATGFVGLTWFLVWLPVLILLAWWFICLLLIIVAAVGTQAKSLRL